MMKRRSSTYPLRMPPQHKIWALLPMNFPPWWKQLKWWFWGALNVNWKFIGGSYKLRILLKENIVAGQHMPSLVNLRLGSLSKHDADGSENVIWKCNVSAIIFQLFKVILLEKCVLTILKLNWNQRLGHKKTKLNVCHHMLTSSTQLQNWSFHVIERTRTSTKCQKMKNARAKRAKIQFFISNNIHEKISPFWLVKGSAVFFFNSAEKS